MAKMNEQSNTNTPTEMVIHIFSANVAVFREDNQKLLINFFKGLISSAYHDGTSYRLYLDLIDHKIFEDNVINPCPRARQSDPNLVLITEVKGYDKNLNQKRYNLLSDDDIFDWGYQGWLEGIEHKIMTIINDQ